MLVSVRITDGKNETQIFQGEVQPPLPLLGDYIESNDKRGQVSRRVFTYHEDGSLVIVLQFTPEKDVNAKLNTFGMLGRSTRF